MDECMLDTSPLGLHELQRNLLVQVIFVLMLCKLLCQLFSSWETESKNKRPLYLFRRKKHVSMLLSLSVSSIYVVSMLLSLSVSSIFHVGML